MIFDKNARRKNIGPKKSPRFELKFSQFGRVGGIYFSKLIKSWTGVLRKRGLIPTVWYSNKCDGIKMPDNAQILYYSGYALCQSAMLLADH